jgi:hypothetical protein
MNFYSDKGGDQMLQVCCIVSMELFRWKDVVGCPPVVSPLIFKGDLNYDHPLTMPPKKSEKALKKAFQKSHQAIDDRHAKSSALTSISGTSSARGNIQVTSGRVITAPELPVKKARIQLDTPGDSAIKSGSSESASPLTSIENENGSAEATASFKPYVNLPLMIYPSQLTVKILFDRAHRNTCSSSF